MTASGEGASATWHAKTRSLPQEDAAVCMSGHRPEEKDMKRPFYWPGSGDFVLASKQLILAVRGYPEVGRAASRCFLEGG